MKKLLLTMLCGLLCSLFSTAATTYQYEWEVPVENNKYVDNPFSSSSTAKFGDIEWKMTTSITGIYLAKDQYTSLGMRGWQFGKSKQNCTPLTFSSTGFSGKKINAVKVTAAAGVETEISVTVGSEVFTTGAKNASTATVKTKATNEFTGTATDGEIKITYNQSATGNNAKAVYLIGISVAYEEGGSSVNKPTININGTEVEGGYEEGATATISWGTDAVLAMYTIDSENDPSYANSVGELFDGDSTPISLSVGPHTIKAIAIDNDGNESEVESKTITVVAKQGPVVEKPVITITGEKLGDDYLIGATASISAPKASYIFYTTDGSDPKAEGNTAVTEVEGTSVDLGKLALGETTIKAYIWDADAVESTVASLTVKVVKKSPELAWSETTCTVYLGEEPYHLPTLSHAEGIADNEIVYSIPAEDNGIATIDQDGNITIVGLGTTIVTATYTTTETSEIDNGTASYKLVVADKGSIHKTSYLFDFKNQDYGLTRYSSGTKYETDVESPVTTIMRKGVTMNFVVPENASTTSTYRYWAGSAGNDFRIYSKNAINISVPENGRIISVTFIKGNSGDFAMVPETGTMTGKAYLDGKVTWNAPESKSINSIKFTSEQNSTYNNSTNGRTYIGGIEVVYDLGKPAMPYVVSEDENQIVVACDDYCVLHYIKVQHNGGAQAAPSRAALAGAGKDLVDTESWYDHEAATLTIDKTNQDHVNRGYSFTAYHGDSDMRSDALNLLVDQSGTLTGVEGISAEADADAPVEFYDLQGRMVANPQGGIFIRRQGNKVTKVAL